MSARIQRRERPETLSSSPGCLDSERGLTWKDRAQEIHFGGALPPTPGSQNETATNHHPESSDAGHRSHAVCKPEAGGVTSDVLGVVPAWTEEAWRRWSTY